MRDIYEVLHKKQAEQAQLGKQIEALQTAAEQLRGVAHLLDDEHEEARSRRRPGLKTALQAFSDLKASYESISARF